MTAHMKLEKLTDGAYSLELFGDDNRLIHFSTTPVGFDVDQLDTWVAQQLGRTPSSTATEAAYKKLADLRAAKKAQDAKLAMLAAEQEYARKQRFIAMVKKEIPDSDEFYRDMDILLAVYDLGVLHGDAGYEV